MASMEKESFWGCELSKNKKEYRWDSEDEELSKADIEQKLVLSQACLGVKAKPSEKNVVEVTTTDSSDNSVTHTIVCLQSGRTDQCRLSLGFPSSVVFKLAEGSGPVHLTGSVYQELYIDDDDDEEVSDEDEEVPQLVKPEAKLASKKRPLSSETPKGPPKKLARVENEDEDESDDDEEDEEESSDEADKMEVETKEKLKKPVTAPKAASNKTEDKNAKVKKGTEDSDDDDQESDEDESDDDDEEEDESDEDESEEDDDDEDEEDDESDEDEIADSLAAKKKGGKTEQQKPMTNGVAKQGKKPAEEKEKPNKTPAKQPSTPKTGGKKEDDKKAATKSPGSMSMDEIKEKLKKTPSLPKKVDKFKNYMRSSFKITDEGTVTKLWDWLKENK